MHKRKFDFKSYNAVWCLFIAAATISLMPAEAYPIVKRQIEPGLYAELEKGKYIFLIASATDENDISDWANRMLADPERKTKYIIGNYLRVPLSELTEEYRLETIKTLFKKDSYDEHGWVHVVTYLSSYRRGGETLWSISRWFTGNPRNYKKIIAHNRMSEKTRLYKGTKIKIPINLLKPAFKEPILFEIAARRAAESPSMESKRLNKELILKTDSQGPYASYQMKKGDTIYSKVVMRYTDRITAADVLEAADIICRRSGIKDARKIKPGDEIKVPLSLLAYMYLPPTDPRRQEYERLKKEAERYSNPVRTAELKDIILILDPGHGGNDPGALGKNRIYEDEVVYDIMCRIKRLLETPTLARVIPTVIDKSQNYKPRDVSSFSKDTDEYVLTNPHYKNHSAKVSANLRWYLANSIYRKQTAQGADPDKIVFVSLHADSLHYEARGTMIYIPGTYFCRGKRGKSGWTYTPHAEVREKQYIEIPYRDRVRSEGLSGELAKHLIKSLSKHRIMVHKEKPIRNHIVRRRRAYVPAVIRHNIVPTKILIEVVNLRNEADCKLVADATFRQRYANAFVDALKQYYGGK